MSAQDTAYRFTEHHRPDGSWCGWSHVSVLPPGERTNPGDTQCPDRCTASDVELDPTGGEA